MTKQWFVLGVLMMITVSAIKAHDATPVPAQAYVVNLSTNPTNVEVNKPFTLTLNVLNADGKTPVTAFDEVHTKLPYQAASFHFGESGFNAISACPS